MSSPKCPNCDAELPASEIADGWCETCGKRLPSFVSGGGRAAATASPYARRRADTKKITFGGIVVMTVCAAIGMGVATVALKGVISMSLGCGIGCAVGVLIGRQFGLMPTSDD